MQCFCAITMAKCEKCGMEYVKLDVKVIEEDGKPRRIPQAKQGCPYCEGDKNKENQRKFYKDMFDRLNNRNKNSNLES